MPPFFHENFNNKCKIYLFFAGAGEFPEQILFTRSEVKEIDQFFPNDQQHVLEVNNEHTNYNSNIFPSTFNS